MKLLFVIDMQNDFIDGVLGSPEAQVIVPKVIEKIKNANFDLIVLTQDTHHIDYLKTEEGKHLPIKHCLYKTKGWEIHEDISNLISNYLNHDNIFYIEKETFGYPWNNESSLGLKVQINSYLFNKKIEEIEIIGLDTDFCVLANAMTLKAAFPNTPITIDAACCAGSTPEWHEKALDMLEHCHFNVINRIKGE